MTDDLIAKLRAIKVRTPEEVMAQPSFDLVSSTLHLTQNEWFEFYKEQEGVEMASMGDLYFGFKALKRMWEDSTKLSEVRVKVQVLQEYFKRRILSSTRIIYSKDDLSGTIIHHYDLKGSSLRKEIHLEVIPVYEEMPIAGLQSEGVKYIQALFDTNDDLEEIVDTFEFVDPLLGKSVRLFSAEKKLIGFRREHEIERMGVVGCDFGNLNVSGSEYLYISGCSYGVRF